MNLKRTTDYSIRLLLYLLALGTRQPVPCVEIAKEIGVSPGYIKKVSADLRNKGFLLSDQGVQGGFFLTEKGREATLYDVVTACEGEIQLCRCPESEGQHCPRFTMDCKVSHRLNEIKKDIETSLRSITLESLL